MLARRRKTGHARAGKRKRDRLTLAREDLKRRWDEQVTQFGNPNVELTAEEFAPLLSTFRTLQQLGARLDRALVVLIDKLAAQVRGSEDDADADGYDQTVSDTDRHAWPNDVNPPTWHRADWESQLWAQADEARRASMKIADDEAEADRAVAIMMAAEEHAGPFFKIA